MFENHMTARALSIWNTWDQNSKSKYILFFLTLHWESPKYLLLTLFPMAGGRCVSRQFKIDSIQAGMKFSGLQLNDNSFLSIL